MSEKGMGLEASRRSLLLGAGAVAAAWPETSLFAQPAQPAAPQPTAQEIAAQLPLRTTGIEHASFWVDDVQQAGVFFGKVFNPALWKEEKEPLRYYVPLTLREPKPPLGYLAIGSGRGRPAQIDHFCALAQGFDARAMAERLKQEGVKTAGVVPVYLDPDNLQFQVLRAPAGLTATNIPAGRIAEGPPIVEPLGIDNVILQVSDLDRSLAYYRKFFDGKATRDGDRVWIDAAGTRVGFMTAPEGRKPVISSVCVRVRAFDRKAVSQKLETLGARITPAPKVDGDVLRFRSPMGIEVDLKATRA
jgi:catechol 2,3-dioxygenase-like lactoylglutathione lyase family enzyme